VIFRAFWKYNKGINMMKIQIEMFSSGKKLVLNFRCAKIGWGRRNQKGNTAH